METTEEILKPKYDPKLSEVKINWAYCKILYNKNISSNTLVELLMSEYEGMAFNHAQKITALAKKKYKNFVDTNVQEHRENAIRERQAYIIRMRELGQYKQELEGMKDRDIILGVYVPKVEHSGSLIVEFVPVSQCPDLQN